MNTKPGWTLTTAADRLSIRNQKASLLAKPRNEIVAEYQRRYKVSYTRGVSKLAMVISILIAEHGERRYTESMSIKN